METATTATKRSTSRARIAIAPITDVEVRDATATGDGSWQMDGYAAVFGQETALYDSRFYRLREVIAPGAFRDVLASNPLVHLNFGHDMNTAIASTAVAGIGGLHLADDAHGLRFTARVSRNDPDAVRLAEKMRLGIVRQASFAFTIDDEELVEEEVNDAGQIDELWRINRVRDLYDVCACAQGAYPQTESHLRGLHAAYLGQPADPRHRPNAAEGADVRGGEDIVDAPVSGVQQSSRLAVARLKARVTASRYQIPDRSES